MNENEKKFYKTVSNLIINRIHPFLVEGGYSLDQSPITPENINKLAWMVVLGAISDQTGKLVLTEMMANVNDPNKTTDPGEIVSEKEWWIRVEDNDQIEKWIDQVIIENPIPAAEFKAGKNKAIGSLIGKVIRLSENKADPKVISELLVKKLRGE
jgi:aspartyl-tRNA(Asn)/glutamyl-tRNA(Gln) amidotransferase subunit B